MANNTKVKAGWTARCLFTLAVAAVTATTFARTVYDAGKALRQNCESGSYANPYTDANGGVWSYLAASSFSPFSGVALEMHAAKEDGKLDGWHIADQSYPKIMVNVSGQAMESAYLGSPGYPIEADELILHPGDSGNVYAVLRFTVPQDGWYSAFASFHDISYQDSPNPYSGVGAHVTLGSEAAGDTTLTYSFVTLEDFSSGWGHANRTQRFDYQMPVRYLTQGMRIQFVVGPNGVDPWTHMNDGTGVKVLVIKEDEGRFYDSGDAFSANIAADYVNPYGTARHGTWHALLSNLSAAAVATDFLSWIPQNLENSLDHGFTQRCAFNDSFAGFNTTDAGNEPYVTVNLADSAIKSVSPRELYVHPPNHAANKCTDVRFRPPEAGRYSASVVVRFLENAATDGVEVFLVAADQVVTNAVVCGDHVKSTAHLTFDNMLLATGEPVDILVSPRAAYWSDGIAVSAIFRREDGDVFDANKSFYAYHAAGNSSLPFNDILGGGAQWTLGAMVNAAREDSALVQAPAFQTASGTAIEWWVHSYNGARLTEPYVAMTTNAIASSDNGVFQSGNVQLAITPNEFLVHPNTPGQQNSSQIVRGVVPTDGVYRVRGRARDLNSGPSGDGVLFSIAVGNYVSASSFVSRDATRHDNCSVEASIVGDRLWLKAGETIDAAIDPVNVYYFDGTGFSVCYEREDAGTACVVNVDFTGTGTGKFSANTTRGREGYGDWLSWNALRPGGGASAAVENCYEANGRTKRNAKVSLGRNSGAAIATGTAETGNALLDSFVVSSGAEDAYAFRISEVKANEPYTLYLYSANGHDDGNASFTVGGVTKGADEPWSSGSPLKRTRMVARFEVVSDADGEIGGTFAAADENGGAFNGLTLVGDLPDYKSVGTAIFIK